MGQIIVLISGKGGVGKTTACAKLAMALAQQGKSVLCMDCDVQKGDLDIALGVREQMALSFVDICRGGYPLSAALQHPAYPKLRFLCAPIQFRMDEMDMAAFAALMAQAKQEFDYVLVDGGSLGSFGFSLAANHADRCAVLTGFDSACVRATERAGQALEVMGKTDVRIVVLGVEAKKMKALGVTIDDVMDQTGLPLLGIVPEDGQFLLSKGKKADAAYTRIAKRIQGQPVPVPTR